MTAPRYVCPHEESPRRTITLPAATLVLCLACLSQITAEAVLIEDEAEALPPPQLRRVAEMEPSS